MKATVLVTLLILLVTGGIYLSVGHHSNGIQQKGEVAVRKDTRAMPASVVLDVRPGVESLPARTQSDRTVAVSENVAQYRARKDFLELYGRIDQDPTPEALYLKSQIYSECARPPGQTAKDVSEANAAKRAKFLYNISQSNKDITERLSAFERLSSDPCVGLDLGNFDKKMYDDMVAAAAAAGDVRAKALQLAESVEAPYYTSNGLSLYSLTDAEMDQARQLLASGDPDVIQALSGVLSSTLNSGAVRLNGQPINQSAMYAALGLLACDAGAQCGQDSVSVLRGCAYQSQCSAQNAYEYSYYYENAPSQSQLIDSYRQSMAAMLHAHDFSGITYVFSDAPSGYTVTFGRVQPGG